MLKLIKRIRNKLINTADSVCLERARLVTEAYKKHKDKPVILKRALAFEYVLNNMTLDLETNPVFAGNTSSKPRGWMLLPEYTFSVPAQAPFENSEHNNFLKGDVIPDDLREYWQNKSMELPAGIGHLAVNIEKLLNKGLEGIINEINSYIKHDDTGEDITRKSFRICCQAVIDWASRYTKAAEEAAWVEKDPVRKDCLLRVADACNRVPAKPASNLFEALQSIILVHMAIIIEGHGYSVSPGNLDRYLAKYSNDTEVDTTDLLAAFILKLSEVSLWGSHSKTQCITLGGVDSKLQDKTNKLTASFLDAINIVRMPDPQIFLRWHHNLNKGIKMKTLQMLNNGLSMPMLIGDRETVQGLVNAGIEEEDAWNYCVIGCNELGVPGKLMFLACYISGLKILDNIIKDDHSLSTISSMNNIIALMKKEFKRSLKNSIENYHKRWDIYRENGPTPFTSALMDNCIKFGQDMHNHLEYDVLNTVERGFTNLVNSLTAIEKLVFSDKEISFSELVKALKNNFKNQEDLKYKLEACRIWGEDSERANKWAQSWMKIREQEKLRIIKEKGIPVKLSCHLVRSLHYVEGESLGATPDGREARKPLADSIGAQGGVSSQGPTANLRDVMNLNASKYWTGGYNFNLTLPPTSTDEEYQKNLALIETFFDHGGQELQINIIDSYTLKDARKNPEKYPNLMVRIAGFNALFTHLSDIEQEEIIERAVAMERSRY